MIYLDNASTTYPKPENVYAEMDRCHRQYCANPGRGGHAMGRTAGEAVQKTREAIGRLFNFGGDPQRIIFTKNATEALNIAIKGTLHAGDHVIATTLEHNSVVRPLKDIEKERGVEIKFIEGNAYGEISASSISASIRRNTRLIVCTISSNVNGIIMPVGEIGKIANAHEVPFLVDASQGAGSIPIDVKAMMIDLLAFPGHKSLLGPQGTGGLCIREGIEIKPLIQGGTGTSSEIPYQPRVMPQALESGTLNTPGIIGLGAGIEFIRQTGLKTIFDHKSQLVSQMHEALVSHPKIHLYSLNASDKNSGIVALGIDGMTSTRAAELLDQRYHIAARAGLHCAPLAHQVLGYSIESGVLRLSVGYFNTTSEVDYAARAVREIAG